ncbi:MAG TPA: hypothetical protein VGQ83_40085 [Polyangia bacterium]|jgi:hypothetical protein
MKHEESTREHPARKENDINHIRARLDELVDELDRRRHEVTNVKLQVSRHKTPIAIAGGSVFALAGGITAFSLWRRRRRHTLRGRADRARGALEQIAKHPDRVVAKVRERLGPQVFGTIVTTLIGFLVARGAEAAIGAGYARWGRRLEAQPQAY